MIRTMFLFFVALPLAYSSAPTSTRVVHNQLILTATGEPDAGFAVPAAFVAARERDSNAYISSCRSTLHLLRFAIHRSLSRRELTFSTHFGNEATRMALGVR